MIVSYSKYKKLRENRNYMVEKFSHEINTLKAENERLKEEKETLKSLLDSSQERYFGISNLAHKYRNKYKTAKAEAHKEFAERLHEELRIYGIKDKFNKSVFLNVVDKAKKELQNLGER